MSGLVRVHLNGQSINVSAAHATKRGLVVVDEPTHNLDGTPRRPTRANGRPLKPKTTVAASAATAKKKAAATAAQTAEEATA